MSPHILLCSMCFALFAPQLGAAETAADLRAQIATGGTHANDEQRNSVSVDRCVMTTERWRNRPEQGWVLWSSFQFNMWNAELAYFQKDPPKNYFYAGEVEEPNPSGLVLVGFKMRGETTARFEKSEFRPRKGETAASPRGDGTSHYFERIDDFFFSMQGENVEAKAKLFTDAYIAYVRQYCTPIG